MAIDPRSGVIRLDEQDYHGQTYAYDGTLTGPTLGTMGAVVSPSVGLAVTFAGNATVGLGAADGRFVGKIKVMSDDGHCTVQDEGMMVCPITTTGTVPVAGDPVTVDGTGKVQKATAAKGAAYAVAVDATTVTVKI